MSKNSKATPTTTVPSSVSQLPGSLEMSMMSANEKAASKPADVSLADAGDVTDDVIDSEDTMSFDQNFYPSSHNNTNTTTTTIITNNRDTEYDDDDDDDDLTTATATNATPTAEDDDDDDDDDVGNVDGNRKRKKKRPRSSNNSSNKRGDSTLLITTTSRDKKPFHHHQHHHQTRNGQFQAGVSNPGASVQLKSTDEDCWSKDLERDTPSPNLDESKKNWETRCIVVVVVVAASLAAAIFVFFLTGQSKGESMIDFRFSNYLSSHMVLQGSPHRAVIWGYGPKLQKDEEVKVVVRMYRSTPVTSSSMTPPTAPDPTLSPSFEYQTKVATTAAGSTWKVVVGPVSEAGPFRITAILATSSGEHVIKLENVLFGDVWLCSGHDRLYDNINKLINFTEDASSSSSSSSSSSHGVDDDLFRIYSVFPAKSDIPWFDVHVVDINWSMTNRANLMRIRDRSGHASPRFPSICWLLGKKLVKEFRKPIGIVSATYGDSSMEEWAPSTVIDSCSLEYPDSCSRIWNGMIHPLLEMQVRGMIWQQGSFSGEDIPVNYSCSLKEFFNQWRAGVNRRLSVGYNSTGDISLLQLPIGVIQLLPTNSSQYGPISDVHSAHLRWLTSDGFGYLPNGKMKSIFQVVTIDLPNPEEISQKRIIADRLFRGISNLAYMRKKVNFQGPIPIKYVAKTQNSLALTFDVDIKVQNDNGFEICCAKSRNLTCRGEPMGSNFFWTDSPLVSPHSDSTITISGSDCPWHIVGFRYAWRDTPCEPLGCLIYSKESGLPMAPYLRLGLIDDGFVRELNRDSVSV